MHRRRERTGKSPTRFVPTEMLYGMFVCVEKRALKRAYFDDDDDNDNGTCWTDKRKQNDETK